MRVARNLIFVESTEVEEMPCEATGEHRHWRLLGGLPDAVVRLANVPSLLTIRGVGEFYVMPELQYPAFGATCMVFGTIDPPEHKVNQ